MSTQDRQGLGDGGSTEEPTAEHERTTRRLTRMGYTGDVEQWLAAVVETAQEAMYSSDADGVVTSWNPAAEQLYGWTAEEIVGRSAQTLIPEDRAGDVTRLAPQVLAGRPVPPFVTERVRKDGRRVRVSVALSPVRSGAAEVVGISVSAHEVGGEREAREALRRNEETLRVIVDSIPYLVTYVDRQGRYRLNNRAYGEWYGMDPAAMQGRPMREVLPPGVWSRIERHVQAALSGERIEHETRIVLPDGSEQWVRSTYVPHVDAAGAVEGFVGLVQDVTERKEFERRLSESKAAADRHAEELSLLDRRKDEFLVTLSHELRSPLTAVIAALELLRHHEEARPDPDALRLCDVIGRQTQNLRRLVDDLLDAARIAEGKLRLELGPVDLREVIRGSAESLESEARRLGQCPELDLPAAPVTVEGDAQRLQQVVTNLLHNAAKYSPSGTPLGVRLHAEGGHAVLEVWDRGPGIEPQLLARVFDLFVQGAPPGRSSGAGLGVGLNLVRRLVERHGGAIEAHSPGPGRGSTFTVRLPLLPDTAGPQPPAEPEAAAPGLHRRILVVEDDRDAADMLATLLRTWGHTVLTAHDGPEALAAAAAFAPEVAILDLGLPGMPGLEVAGRLREVAGCEGVLLFGLTGHAAPDDRRRAAELGFREVLIKPPRIARLQGLLRDLGEAPPVTR